MYNKICFSMCAVAVAIFIYIYINGGRARFLVSKPSSMVWRTEVLGHSRIPWSNVVRYIFA